MNYFTMVWVLTVVQMTEDYIKRIRAMEWEQEEKQGKK